MKRHRLHTSSALFLTIPDQVSWPSSFQRIKCPLGRSLIYPHHGNISLSLKKPRTLFLLAFSSFSPGGNFKEPLAENLSQVPPRHPGLPSSPSPSPPSRRIFAASPLSKPTRSNFPSQTPAGAPSWKPTAAGATRPGAPGAVRRAPRKRTRRQDACRPPVLALGAFAPGHQDLNSHPLRRWGSSAKPRPLLCTRLRPPSPTPRNTPAGKPSSGLLGYVGGRGSPPGALLHSFIFTSYFYWAYWGDIG